MIADQTTTMLANVQLFAACSIERFFHPQITQMDADVWNHRFHRFTQINSDPICEICGCSCLCRYPRSSASSADSLCCQVLDSAVEPLDVGPVLHHLVRDSQVLESDEGRIEGG